MFVLILAAFSLVADAAITLTPVNQVKVVGHQTVFNCSTSGSTTVMRWRLESANGSPTCTVMVGTTVGDCAQPRFSVSQSATGPYNLIINDTSLSDAGTYSCDDVSATTVPPVSAIYGVIEPNLAVGLSVNETCLLEGETEILTCKVTYKGSNLMPLVMTWTNSSGQTVPSNYTYNTANGLFQSTTYVTVGASYIQPYTCSVNFTAPTGNTSQIVPTPVQATNPPSYTNTTTSPPYNVQLCPRMINITFANGTEFPGGEVTVITILHCSVSGGGVYINTVYNWTETGSSYYIGPNITIPYGNYSLTCTATSSLCGTKFCPTALNKTVFGYSNAVVPTTVTAAPTTQSQQTSSVTLPTTTGSSEVTITTEKPKNIVGIVVPAVVVPCVVIGTVIVILICCCCECCCCYTKCQRWRCHECERKCCLCCDCCQRTKGSKTNENTSEGSDDQPITILQQTTVNAQFTNGSYKDDHLETQRQGIAYQPTPDLTAGLYAQPTRNPPAGSLHYSNQQPPQNRPPPTPQKPVSPEGIVYAELAAKPAGSRQPVAAPDTVYAQIQSA